MSPTNNTTTMTKTALCRSHFKYQNCRFGKKCRYAHNESELTVEEREPRKSELCRFHFMDGFCNHGSKCPQAHTFAEWEQSNHDTTDVNYRTRMCMHNKNGFCKYGPPGNPDQSRCWNAHGSNQQRKYRNQKRKQLSDFEDKMTESVFETKSSPKKSSPKSSNPFDCLKNMKPSKPKSPKPAKKKYTPITVWRDAVKTGLEAHPEEPVVPEPTVYRREMNLSEIVVPMAPQKKNVIEVVEEEPWETNDDDFGADEELHFDDDDDWEGGYCDEECPDDWMAYQDGFRTY